MKISLNVWMSILSCCLKPTEVGGCQGLFYDVAACLRMRNCNVLNLVCWFQSSDYCIVYRVFLFADEWMSQWSLDTVGFCFGLVQPVSFSFFCHEPSVLTKYLQCWSNTHSESCIKSLSHLSQVEAGSLDTYWGSTSDFSAKLLHCVKIFD